MLDPFARTTGKSRHCLPLVKRFLSPSRGETDAAASALRCCGRAACISSIGNTAQMTSSLLPVLILGFVIVSYIALRPFSSRVRYLFDFVCFAEIGRASCRERV